jgi:hypothetical protein
MQGTPKKKREEECEQKIKRITELAANSGVGRRIPVCCEMLFCCGEAIIVTQGPQIISPHKHK